MIKLMKYLKRSAGYIVLIIALLFLQAYCDLSLPNYTSNIINVGIQQNGIEDSVPDKIRKTSMESLKLFMDEEDKKIKQEMIQVTKQAAEKIIDMKIVEGYKISQDLLRRIDKIENKMEEISSKSTGLIEEYVVKLEKRVKEILKTDEIDKSRLAEEVVIYADKCSIEEEITRLKSHIYQFRNLIASNENEPIGKKLDFIIQEMNRETNTIGSKANNLEITNGVIDIKTELEDIREQIQNIE